MHLLTKNPLWFVFFAIVFFAAGVVFDKLLTKKKTEKFFDGYTGIPSTVKEFADSPKVLPPVKQNPGVTDHDGWCALSNC